MTQMLRTEALLRGDQAFGEAKCLFLFAAHIECLENHLEIEPVQLLGTGPSALKCFPQKYQYER